VRAPSPTTKGKELMTTFPVNFLWGAATAAHQIEGNNVNSDLWAVENEPDSPLPERSGDACDSYHRWAEDLDILSWAGLNTYRFSLDWSRIEPSPGHVSNAELAHYRRIIDGCFERRITPVVTAHHFSSPRWFAQRGGWLAEDAVARFENYVRAVVPIVKDVPWVCTFNEPNMLAMMVNMLREGRRAENVAGAMPPPDVAISNVLIQAHHAVTPILREGTSAAVGWTIANQNFQAAPGADDVMREWAWFREDLFIDAARADDFIGIQAYTRVRIGHDGALPLPDGARTTITGWEYYPTAAAEALRHTAQLAPGVPLLVTENGIATADDRERIEYTTGSLQAVAAAIADGIDVRGYIHWSLLDNFEWGSYAPTFGLIAVDRETFARTPKPSLGWLGGIAQHGTLPA
jgi:beta-glucosidase